MSYTFRLRLNRSPLSFLQTELSEIKIAIPEDGTCVFLRAALPQDASLQNAEQWVLAADGYQTEGEALKDGERLGDALAITLAILRIGVNFGERSAQGQFTTYGLQSLEGTIGHRILDNVHGLMVYRSEPKPMFASMGNPTLSVGRPIESFQDAFSAIVASKCKLTDRERIAFSLFNSSFFQPLPDSRFLLLMMSIETLIDPQSKSPEALKQVEGFIGQIEISKLGDEEKKSLIGRLSLLRKESINQAGKRLVKERLGGKIYEGKVAPKFFSDIYDMRSRLVHGLTPFPTFREVNAMAAPTEVFVSELLTAPFV